MLEASNQHDALTRLPVRLRQVKAVLAVEVRRNLWGSRGVWVFFLAFAPTCIAIAHVLIAKGATKTCSLDQDTNLLAWFYQLFYVRLVCYFGCLGIFVRMVRAEMVDHTMHYALIAPIRRELLILGKYLAGSLGSAALFTTGSAICFITMVLHHGSVGTAYLLNGPGLVHLTSYVGVVLLACFGYSAVFLALGLAFRNPVLPAVVFWGWESLSGMLPASLQVLSVTYYLKPLFPVVLPVVGISGLFTVVTEPIPIWLAVLGLFFVSSVVVTLCALYFRGAELGSSES